MQDFLSSTLPVVSFSEARKRAKEAGFRLELPEFETEPKALAESLEQCLAQADERLDAIAALLPERLDFANTVAAFDDVICSVSTVANRLYLLKEAAPEKVIREEAERQFKIFQDWDVGLEYREDIYRTIRAFADGQSELAEEARRLMEHFMRDFRRAGLGLSRGERDEVERLRKRLSRIVTDFDANATKAESPVEFTVDELEGLPRDFLDNRSLRNFSGNYVLGAETVWHFLVVMDNAKSEAVRRRMQEARDRLAADTNLELLQEIIRLRADIARRLGYADWADYRTELKMAKTGAGARRFLEDLSEGLQELFAQEREAWQAMKREDTSDPEAVVHLWDWRYYSNQLVKRRHQVDNEKLRRYFPYRKTLEGMFRICGRLFGLSFARLEAPRKWTNDLELYLVTDVRTQTPRGAFYLDLFPRKGKFRHYAQFGLIDGRRLPDGDYQCPCVALVCNFPPPNAGQPSLLSHTEVKTLFHEFGHALHSLLTRAEYARFSGTAVPRDFVEVPSQLLENWIWDQDMLDLFAADWQDENRKIPAGVIEGLKAARLETIGSFYRRQIAFGLIDLELHSVTAGSEIPEASALAGSLMKKVFLEPAEGTDFIAGFTHLSHYDAGYYGYAWADAIAADLDTVFSGSPSARLNEANGRRLREEIYATGDTRDPEESITSFLGRPRSLTPFLKSLGVSGRPPAGASND